MISQHQHSECLSPEGAIWVAHHSTHLRSEPKPAAAASPGKCISFNGLKSTQFPSVGEQTMVYLPISRKRTVDISNNMGSVA